MIGKIKGKLTECDGNLGLVETTSGISYHIFLTPTLLKKYPLGSVVDIYTYLQVREDALILFGFQSKEEYEVYKMLLTVSGVGPKTAYNVISFSNLRGLFEAVHNNNSDYFTRIPGLGKKTALKILLELSQKMGEEFKLEKTYLTEDDKIVIEALVSLGFKSLEAKHILSQIPKELSVEKRITEAIRLASNPKDKRV